MRLSRGDECLRRAAVLLRGFLVDWAFLLLLEDCTGEAGIAGARSEHRTVPIKAIPIRTGDKRWKTTLINFAENWRP
jgi:hypothetical protein